MSGKLSFLVGTSEVSGTSDTVHARPAIQKDVLQRIVELKNSGMGYRKISEQLKKEGLATLRKSSIAKLYHEKAMPLMKEAEKELGNDEEYRVLSEKEVKLQKEVDRAKMIEEVHKNIKRLLLETARTSEGIRDIFSSPQYMLEFTETTVDYRSLTFKNARVLDLFSSHCQAHNLSLSETLFKAVGNLDEYEADADENGIFVDLDNYIGLQLEFFLMNIQEEERKKALQKKFEDDLLGSKCPECDQPLARPLEYPKVAGKTLLMIDGFLWCNSCDARLQMHCPGCKGLLHYTEGYKLHCDSCDLTFTVPHSKNRDSGISMKIEWSQLKLKKNLKIGN